MSTVGVLTVVASQAMVGQALTHVLESRGYRVNLAVDGRDPLAAPPLLVRTILLRRADAVIVSHDVSTPDASVALVRQLSGSGMGVIVLTTSRERRTWGRFLVGGARTVLPYSAQLSELTAAVRATVERRPCMSRSDREELIGEWATYARTHAEGSQRLALLTRRERTVLDELMLGRTVVEISRLYVVSPATVRSQVKSILSKLGVSSQVSAVGMAHGLRQPA